MGNVLATTSDLPYRTGDHVSTGSYSAALKAAYDYYPFGSLKPGRFVSDTTSRCVTYTQSKWVTKTKDSTYWHSYNVTVLNWVLAPINIASTPRQIVNVVNQGTLGYQVTVTDTASVGTNMELRQALEVNANETQTIVVSAEVLQGAFVLQAVEEVNGNERLLASTNLLPGGSGDDGAVVAQNFSLNITPQTSNVSLRLSAPQNLGNVGTGVTPLGSPPIITTPPSNVLLWQRVTVKVNYLEQEQFTVTLCDSIEDKYRFGFNGQEKVNEIAGIGNHNTAEFWEYDTRLGRRWNVDPEFKRMPNESPYASNHGNPIAYKDPKGDFGFIGSAIGAATGAILEYGSQAVSNLIQGKSLKDALWNEIDFADVGVSAVEGALAGTTGGVSLIFTKVTAGTVRASIDYTKKDGLKYIGGEKQNEKKLKDVLLDVSSELVGGLVGAGFDKAGLKQFVRKPSRSLFKGGFKKARNAFEDEMATGIVENAIPAIYDGTSKREFAEGTEYEAIGFDDNETGEFVPYNTSNQ